MMCIKRYITPVLGRTSRSPSAIPRTFLVSVRSTISSWVPLQFFQRFPRLGPQEESVLNRRRSTCRTQAIWNGPRQAPPSPLPLHPVCFLFGCCPKFAASNSEELGVKCVPSLNLVYTEEEGYVTADVAESKNLVSRNLQS